MVAVVDAYSISLFLHISAVVVGFGATYAGAIMYPVAMNVDKRHLPYVHRLSTAINQRLTTPALVVILVTGLYQVAENDRGWSLGDPWISATFALLIVLAGMIHGYFVPTDRRLAEMAERDLAAGSSEMSAEYQGLVRRIGALGGVAGLLVLIAIFLMTTKPGA